MVGFPKSGHIYTMITLTVLLGSFDVYFMIFQPNNVSLYMLAAAHYTYYARIFETDLSPEKVTMHACITIIMH